MAILEFPTNLLNILQALTSLRLVALIDVFARIADKLFPMRRNEGMYEVINHEVCLELKDTGGKTSIYTKRQRVRFLQDNIIAYQDQAWGDGDIFAEYRCSPGIPVDRYREGQRYRILISLRETKNRGDIEGFHIERTIKDGFTRPTEEFQTQMSHRTLALAMTVIFPAKRRPRHVWLIEQNAFRTMPLGVENQHELPDGRFSVSWETNVPILHESYIMRWEW